MSHTRYDIPRTCPTCHETKTVRHYRPAPNGIARLCRPCAGRQRTQEHKAKPVDIDDVVVHRLMTGTHVHSTRAERVQATANLHALRGFGPVLIAARLHVSTKTVSRYLKELNA